MVNSFTSMSGDGLSLKTNWKHEGYISYIPIFVACTLLFRVSIPLIVDSSPLLGEPPKRWEIGDPMENLQMEPVKSY